MALEGSRFVGWQVYRLAATERLRGWTGGSRELPRVFEYQYSVISWER